MSSLIKCFLILLSLFLLACGHTKQYKALPAGTTVLVLGDSISYGTGANAGEDYPSLLAKKTGWNIINAGIPGDTTELGLVRLPALLEKNSPKLVLVELGGNDFLDQLPRAQTTANLKKILAMIKIRQIPTILLAVPKPNLFGEAIGKLSDDPMYEQLGKETDTAVIGEELSNVLEQNDLKSDQIHPNALGYQELAEALHDALKSQGFLK
jgi:acyl-CoA thioesterase-1